MTLLVITILFIQAILMYRVYGSWLFPPAMFAAYWAGVIACSTMIRFGDFSLTVDAMMVFLVGSIVFSIGGYTATCCIGPGIPREPISPLRKRFIQNCIIVYSVGLLALVPLFFSTLRDVSESLGIEEFAVAVRFAFSEGDRVGIPRYFVSLTAVGGFLAYCAAWLYERTRWDKVVLGLAIFAPLIMNVLTFGRTPIYMLLTGVMAIMVFRNTVRKRTILISAFLGVSLATLIGTLLGKGPNFDSGKSSLYAIVENMAIYFVGGPVGFGHVMEVSSSVGEPGLSLRFFTQAASSFGVDITLPNIVLGYFSDVLGNVYTIYFAYWLDWGWWGVVAMASLAGFICTLMYLMARKGNPVAGVCMGIVTGAILNSATGDWIFYSSIPWLLIILIVFLLWNIPVLDFRSRGSRYWAGAKGMTP
jgi:oligosaccharide repeat unit polymerase